MRKKYIELLAVLLFTIVFFASAVIVNAEEVTEPEEGPVTEEYTNAKNEKATLSISGGTATATASIQGVINTTTELAGTFQLQRKVSGSWSTVFLWNASTTGYTLSTSRTINVSKGTYRVVASFRAYSGSSCEFITAFSPIVIY